MENEPVDTSILSAITGGTSNPIIELEPSVSVEVSVDLNHEDDNKPDKKKKKKKIISKFNFTPMSLNEAEQQAKFGLYSTEIHENEEYKHEYKEEDAMEKIMKKSEEMANQHTIAGVPKRKKKGKLDAKSDMPTTTTTSTRQVSEVDTEYDPYDELDKE